MFKCRQLKPEGEKACPEYYRRGFTLMEILVAISLSLLLLGSLYGVYITSYKSYRSSIGKAELNQNARISLERISRDLRQGERITTPLPPDNTDPMNPPSSEIQFQDGHDVSKIRYIKYALSSGNLTRQVIHYYFTSDPTIWVTWNAQDQFGNQPSSSIDEDTVRADKITSIKFYGIKVITIEIVASDTYGSYTYRTEALGRNIQ